MRITLDITGGPDDVVVSTASGQTSASTADPTPVAGGAGPDGAPT